MSSSKSKTTAVPLLIDLSDDVVTKQSSLFSGDYGKTLAEKYGLLSTVATQQPIEVVVPHHIYTLTSSFFLGMFGVVLEMLGGPEEFRKHVTFDTDSDSTKRSIETAIDEVWRRLHPINEPVYESSDTDF